VVGSGEGLCFSPMGVCGCAPRFKKIDYG